MVLFSLARANLTGALGHAAEANRLNVAITRARRHLEVVGNMETVEKSKHSSENHFIHALAVIAKKCSGACLLRVAPDSWKEITGRPYFPAE